MVTVIVFILLSQNLGPNETSFSYYLPHEGQSFFFPQADSDFSFRFKVNILKLEHSSTQHNHLYVSDSPLSESTGLFEYTYHAVEYIKEV